MAKPQKNKPTPAAAVDRLEELYGRATVALASALDRYLLTRKPPSLQARATFRYPLLQIIHAEGSHPSPVNSRAFAKLQRPGVFETTITHPGPFRGYLLEQLEPLVREYGVEIKVGVSEQEIPYPYVLERTKELARAGITAGELARHFSTPQLATVGDEI